MNRSEKEFADGIWFGVEYLACTRDEPGLAEELINESGIDVSVFRKILAGTGYGVKELGKVLDGIK